MKIDEEGAIYAITELKEQIKIGQFMFASFIMPEGLSYCFENDTYYNGNDNVGTANYSNLDTANYNMEVITHYPKTPGIENLNRIIVYLETLVESLGVSPAEEKDLDNISKINNYLYVSYNMNRMSHRYALEIEREEISKLLDKISFLLITIDESIIVN